MVKNISNKLSLYFKNGSMIWNYTDKASTNNEKFFRERFKNIFIKNIDEALYAYNVYQIEGEGRIYS